MEKIIGTKTAIRILSLLLKNPQKEYKEIELIRGSNVGKGAGADAINKLSSLGILKIKRVGKTKIVSLNILNPITFSLRQLFDQHKFISLPENKVSAISLFREFVYNQPKAIVLFGSLAAGTYDEKSDIDLLVITDDEKEINRAKKEISELTDEKINIHFLKPSDVKMEFKENELIRKALMNGILIHGGDYVREIMKQHEDLKELKFLKERINAAWRNYTNKDYESAREILSTVSEDLAFFACKLEGLEAQSRKDAMSKIKKLSEYKILSNTNRLKTEKLLEIIEGLYMKLFNKIIQKGEGIERRCEK
ncbi:MAG: nucleotidyltransferase domain-containing protein [Euryarchaeota archaeon]|nr:nucleotidyltransferase domain-containing protein [Euryarchaeota archaeon]